LLIKDFLAEVLTVVRRRKVATAAIPEEYPLLRTLQFAAQYWPVKAADAAAPEGEPRPLVSPWRCGAVPMRPSGA
jgi:hypothetical protein